MPQDWSETVGIGSHKGQRFLGGALDEVYIYTSALTQKQIRELACICEDSTGNRDLSHLSSTPGSRGVFSNSPFSHLPKHTLFAPLVALGTTVIPSRNKRTKVMQSVGRQTRCISLYYWKCDSISSANFPASAPF